MAAQPGYHYIGEGQGHKLTPKQVMRLAKKYGLPAKGIMQIAKGESGLDANVQQRDPGDGMVGYGLLQMTPNAWGQGSLAYKYMQKLGGVDALKNPETNMKMARFLYKAAGNSFKPWYGTRYLTDRSGEGTLGPVRKRLKVPGLSGATPAATGPMYQTVPGVDNSAARRQLQIDYLQNRHDPDALLYLGQGLRGAQDTPSQRIRVPGSPAQSTASPNRNVPRGQVTLAAGADRPGAHTRPHVMHFLERVAGLAGEPLTIGTGTDHSQMTVNGNVSDHWTGRAADVPAAGKELIKLGRAALIAAGMPRSKAKKVNGGLFNLMWHGRRVQVIFNTQEGGDHTDHLHVGLSAPR